MTRRRQWIAWTVSLIGHTALAALFLSLIPLLKSSESDAQYVDTRIDSTPIQLNLDEPAAAVAALPQAPVPVRAPVLTQPVQTLDAGAPPAPQIPKKVGAASASAALGDKKAQALALHGKLDLENFTVVYVLDRSGSMGRAGKLDKARNLVKASLRQLTPRVKFQIVAYDRAAQVFVFHNRTGAVPASLENIESAEHQLDELCAEGSSRHLEGLRIGLRYQPQLLILLTDSEELSGADAAQVSRWNGKQQTNIHAVVLNTGNSPGDFSVLRKICHAGDGLHFLP